MGKNQRYKLWAFSAFLLVSMALLSRPISDMDEIWNYNFGYNLCKGLVPYLEFNCIVTPFSFFLSAGFLKVFGNSLFVFRCLGILLLALTGWLLFCILQRCSNNKVLAFVAAAFMLVLCYLIWIYNYNNLNLLFILLLLYLELRMEQEKTKPAIWMHIAIGLIYGATVATKQSVGGLLFAYHSVVCLWGWFRQREERKIYGLRFACSLVLPLGCLLYLLFTGSFAGFWDYAVAGVGTFSHRISFWQFMSESVICFLMGLFPVVVTAVSLYSILKKRSAVSRRFHVLALIIGWIGMSVSFPLCDYGHMVIAIVPFSVGGFCCIGEAAMKKWEQYVCIFVAAVVLCAAAVSEMQGLEQQEACRLSNLQGLPISEDLQTHIEGVDAFILEQEQLDKEVLIVDSYAAIYYLPLELYHKDFSLLNVGNLGTQTVEQLLDREDTVYLLRKERSSLNRQNCFEMIEYIAAHYTKVGEILGYEVYQSK